MAFPGSGEYEGFAFAGLGVLLLASLALACKLAGRGLASGDRWVFGRWSFEWRYPALLEPVMQYLRSSGRMAWPLLYVVVFLSLLSLLRRMPARTGLRCWLPAWHYSGIWRLGMASCVATCRR